VPDGPAGCTTLILSGATRRVPERRRATRPAGHPWSGLGLGGSANPILPRRRISAITAKATVTPDWS